MKRFLICAVAIAADFAAIASVIVGCSKSDSDPQELRWRSAGGGYESTTGHSRNEAAPSRNPPTSEKQP